MDFLRSGLRPSLRKSTVFYHKVTAFLILFQLDIAICVIFPLYNMGRNSFGRIEKSIAFNKMMLNVKSFVSKKHLFSDINKLILGATSFNIEYDNFEYVDEIICEIIN